MSLAIIFSHRYNKIPDGFEKSKLIEVMNCNLEDLSLNFINYDTMYLDKDGKFAFYHLPNKGKYMILILRSELNDQIWTTIRRHTKYKEEYYRSHIGEWFDCVVKERRIQE